MDSLHFGDHSYFFKIIKFYNSKKTDISSTQGRMNIIQIRGWVRSSKVVPLSPLDLTVNTEESIFLGKDCISVTVREDKEET